MFLYCALCLLCPRDINRTFMHNPVRLGLPSFFTLNSNTQFWCSIAKDKMYEFNNQVCVWIKTRWWAVGQFIWQPCHQCKGNMTVKGIRNQKNDAHPQIESLYKQMIIYVWRCWVFWIGANYIDLFHLNGLQYVFQSCIPFIGIWVNVLESFQKTKCTPP